MDWTIVVSVLVALLLAPVVMAVLGGLVFLTGATVFRGRIRRFMGGPMVHCRQMFGSRERATAAGSSATAPCPCGETSETG